MTHENAGTGEHDGTLALSQQPEANFVIAVADSIRVSSCDDHAVGFRIICPKGRH